MRIVKTNNQDTKYKLPTTKTCVVVDKYKDATAKTVAKRLKKIKTAIDPIIDDERTMMAFLVQIEKELLRKPGILMKSIKKRANAVNEKQIDRIEAITNQRRPIKNPGAAF